MFMSVALSMVIFAPIAHTGCFSAISGVTRRSSSEEKERKGPRML